MENTRFHVYSDSQLLVYQLIGKYKVNAPHIIVLNKMLKGMLLEFNQLAVTHVLREYNGEADDIANQAVILDSMKLNLSY